MNNHSFGLRIVSALIITGVGLLSNSTPAALATDRDTDSQYNGQTTLQLSDLNPVVPSDEAYANAMWDCISTHG